jgi:predicted nucleotidyltransferase
VSATGSEGADNVVPLELLRQANDSPSMAAGQIRRHLSLLQGYADLMEGVSPSQAVRIMRVMAQKVDDLTETIRPFLEATAEDRPGINRYRKARMENRQLLAEYRLLMRRLRHGVDAVKAINPPPS